jgi:hypothetical protein
MISRSKRLQATLPLFLFFCGLYPACGAVARGLRWPHGIRAATRHPVLPPPLVDGDVPVAAPMLPLADDPARLLFAPLDWAKATTPDRSRSVTASIAERIHYLGRKANLGRDHMFRSRAMLLTARRNGQDEHPSRKSRGP